MPGPSRLMIRLSLCYLLLGVTFGALILLHKALGLHPILWGLLPLHIEALFWGFILQFVMGTAYWMLPRYLEGPSRGSPWMAYVLVTLLNIGILATLAGSFQYVSSTMVIWGRGLELFSVGLFTYLHWNRIVTYRSI